MVIVQRGYIKTCLQGGRIRSVWVAGINRYGWPACVGIPNVLNMLADGMTMKEIISDFPEINEKDILACLSFAADKEHKIAVCA